MRGNLARWKVVAVVAATMLLATACGPAAIKSGSTVSPSPRATATDTTHADPVLCQDAAALRTSAGNLLNIHVGGNTVESVSANLSDVQAKLSALRKSAHDTWSAQWVPLQAALTRLRTEVTDMTNGTASASGVKQALVRVRTAAQHLFDTAKAQCPEL